MEVFSQSVMAVVLLLGILVFVHESGHFLVGKLFKIPVEIFSIGFGPVIFSFQRGETQYRLSVIPLGGFVKFYGSMPSEEVPPELKGREFHKSSILARAATISAGPISNLLLAIVAYAGLVTYGIKMPPASVGEIIPGSPAELSGLQFGDKIIAINGKIIFSWKDVQRMISAATNTQLDIRVSRQDKEVALKIFPETVQEDDLPGKKGRIGISPSIVPSVLTRVSDTGLLSSAGIVTGDRAIRVKWKNDTIEVRYWRQLLAFLSQVSMTSSQAESSFELVVRSELPDKEESKQGPERLLKVTVPLGWSFDLPSSVAMLGVAHSQLTIFSSEEPALALQPGDSIIAWDGKALQSTFYFLKFYSFQINNDLL